MTAPRRSAPPARTEPLTITLPMPQSLANASGGSRHWRTLAVAKKAYMARLDGYRLAGQLPNPPAVPIPFAWLTSEMFLGAAMDDDNAVARHKWAIDWLVTRRYLATDKRTGLRWRAFPEQIVSRKHDYVLRLTLTPDSPPLAVCAGDPDPSEATRHE